MEKYKFMKEEVWVFTDKNCIKKNESVWEKKNI